MMKIKLKETLPTELTKALDVLIMKRGGAIGCESLLNESVPQGLSTYLRKGRNHESERGRRQHPQ
jgi:hypothetical protein